MKRGGVGHAGRSGTKLEDQFFSKIIKEFLASLMLVCYCVYIDVSTTVGRFCSQVAVAKLERRLSVQVR